MPVDRAREGGQKAKPAAVPGVTGILHQLNYADQLTRQNLNATLLLRSELVKFSDSSGYAAFGERELISFQIGVQLLL